MNPAKGPRPRSSSTMSAIIFNRRRVLHFAAVLAAVVVDQVGAVPEPLTGYLQARGPVFRLDLRDRYDGGRANGNDL